MGLLSSHFGFENVSQWSLHCTCFKQNINLLLIRIQKIQFSFSFPFLYRFLSDLFSMCVTKYLINNIFLQEYHKIITWDYIYYNPHASAIVMIVRIFSNLLCSNFGTVLKRQHMGPHTINYLLPFYSNSLDVNQSTYSCFN